MQGLEHLAQFAGVSLVAGIWQGLVLAAAVWICLRLVPRTTASLRFAIWTVVLAVVALLPLIEGEFFGHSSGTGVGSVVRVDVRWSLAIVVLWIAASVYRGAQLAMHAVRLWSVRRGASPVEIEASTEHLLHCGGRDVRLCVSDAVDRPSVVGFFAPRILVPGWLFAQLSAAELEQIILHEVEHLRRGDDWLNLLQKLSLVIFPLNPILLWVERRLCFERELACDDGVLRRTKAPRAYATCLTNLAERGLNRRSISLALGALGSTARESELSRRVHRILRREASLSPLGSRILTGAVALGMIGGVAGFAHCPQLVSFTGVPQTVAAQVAPLPVMSSDRSVHAQDVVFKTSQQPHMMLLNESMPVRRSIPAVRPSATRKHRPVVPAAMERVAARPRTLKAPNAAKEIGWFQLSSWSADSQSQDVAPVAIQTISGPRYAAVPTAGGWLIIQL